MKKFIVLIAALAITLLVVNMVGAATDAIVDGSFEGGSPSAAWAETSIVFGTPLCTAGSCGTGAGTVGPRTGSWWAWFGGSGIGGGEVGSLTQSVVITDGVSATLNFHVWLGAFDPVGTDTLSLFVDGTQVWGVTEATAPGFTAGYKAVSVSLDSYADGAAHSVKFEGTDLVAPITNWSLDDVSLTVAAVAEAEPVPGPDLVEIPDTAVVGSVLADTPVYFAPRTDAATDIIIEAGKTLWVYERIDSFYVVMLSGKFFYMPVASMGPNYDEVWNGTPLP